MGGMNKVGPTVIHIDSPGGLGVYDVRLAQGAGTVHIDRRGYVEVVTFDDNGDVARVEVTGSLDCGCR
jgi:hypothetical protein